MMESCLTCISIAAAVICGIGWLMRWVACAALIKYMIDKGTPLPSDAEIEECCTYVWKKLFHIKTDF